ncbi:MAG TPA: prepilin-type N-terminal cleavage/methylation domain-containing protein [Phycisphaerae bacterium]|nr:prepilin-type N-terminal cleavage/methylation domain-containing protein [Phycisphaerae bacterium]
MRGRRTSSRRSGFTLVELLTVIAIIALLIGILLPSLQGARDQAKALKAKATLKAIGDGLEMFRNDNENYKEFRKTQGYPPSAVAEDATESGAQDIFGAQWLVRYLMGKDLKGYVPRRVVPRTLQDPGAVDEQLDWYDPDAFNDRPLDRVGPYMTTDSATVVAAKDVPGKLEGGIGVDDSTYAQDVMVDTWGYPILYYLADPVLANAPGASIAAYETPEDDTPQEGIFVHADNGLFTGLCMGTAGQPGQCKYGGWDSGGGEHQIRYFGTNNPAPKDETIGDEPKTFPYYILNTNIFEETGGFETNPDPPPTVTPYRKDAFLLISPGKDRKYGTADDVTNFK